MTAPLEYAEQLLPKLRRLAAQGLPALTNDEIAALFRQQSASSGARIVLAGERAGLWVVERGKCSRVIACPRGTWRTAGAAEMYLPPGRWTPEQDAQLRRLWDEGHGGATIAARMGLTRNSIFGRVARLALSGRVSPIRPSAAGDAPVPSPLPAPRRTLAALGVVSADAAEHGEPVPAVLPVSLGCQRPLWGRGRPDGTFCGAPRARRVSARGVVLSPYCAACCAEVYRHPSLAEALPAPHAVGAA